MNSAALVADGCHAHTDGLTSLAVVLGAAGVWLGFPLADPIIGVLITIAIFGIVWRSACRQNRNPGRGCTIQAPLRRPFGRGPLPVLMPHL